MPLVGLHFRNRSLMFPKFWSHSPLGITDPQIIIKPRSTSILIIDNMFQESHQTLNSLLNYMIHFCVIPMESRCDAFTILSSSLHVLLDSRLE